MRIEALLFLSQSLPTHPPETFQPHLATLLKPVIALAEDRYYRTVAEALRVLAEVVRLLRPDPPNKTFAYEAHVPALYANGRIERRLSPSLAFQYLR